MNSYLFCRGRRTTRGGFSLVEAAISLGVLSCGFLAVAPLLAEGMHSARLARDDRGSAQISQTLIEEAKQGTLPTGVIFADTQGTILASAQGAAFSAQSAIVTSYNGNASLRQLTLRVTPLGAPDRVRIYGVVYQAPN